MFNGLIPSMRFEYKFKMKQEDLVVGNHLCTRTLGENARRRWKEFKYFSLVDSRVTMTPKKVSPKCKPQEFLNHMHGASYETWIIDKTF